MKILNEDLVSWRISKNYTIKLNNGREIEINKYYFEDQYISEGDCEVLEESKEEYDKLNDDEMDELDDFINNIDLTK